MNEDKITPAINAYNDLQNDMSSEEFQRRLYGFFEDRGLLSNLRAHLRTQMIGVLKENGVGRIVSSTSISPKQQALNLLIAEFLLQQDYHYSLSVFSAEVPLTNVLPEFPNCSLNKTNLKKWQFSDTDMWDILETLGIQRYTDEAQNIYNVYYNGTYNESLLTCIFKLFNSLQNPVIRNTVESNHLLASYSRTWRKHAYNVLSNHNMNTQTIYKLLKIMADILQSEQLQLRSESRENYLKLEQELQAHFQILLKAREDKIAELQASLDNEIAKKEETAKNYERQQVQHRDRLQKLIVREQYISQREAQIKEKDAFIKAQEFSIKSKLVSLQEDQKALVVLQEKLELEFRDQKLTKQLENLHGVDETKVQDGSEEVNAMMHKMQIENDSLKVVNADQQLQIRELSQRASALVRELEDTQHAYNNLQIRGNGILTVPPLTSPALVNRCINGGGGEEGLRSIHTTYNRTSSNTLESSRRRSSSRKLVLTNSSSSEDLSPTIGLLKEARERLRRLEQESNEIDENYKMFQKTLSNNFNAFNIALTAPRLAMPPGFFNFSSSDIFNLAEFNAKDKPEAKDQDGSSDAWEGAGTSGISFSGDPTSDEKSDSQKEEDCL